MSTGMSIPTSMNIITAMSTTITIMRRKVATGW